MATSNDSIPQGFQPAFKRVEATDDFNDPFAVIAMICGKTLEEVRQTAITLFKHPKHGPYWITGELIAKLLAHYGWVATVWKEGTGIGSLPDLCIGMVDYDPETEIGRYVLFHRMGPTGNSKQIVEYVVDPARWIEPSKHIRTDIKGFPIAWYIGVHQAKSGTSGGK